MSLGYASKGLAGTALGFGIGGTALGLANSGGLLSGLFGGNKQANVVAGACMNPFVSQVEMGNMFCYQNQLSAKDAELAAAKSEVAMLTVSKETDQKISDTYQNLIGIIRSENDKLDRKIECNSARISKVEVDAQRIADGVDRVFDTLNAKIDCCCKELNNSICNEAERRACADNTIVTYANSTFQPNIVIRETATGATLGAETSPENTFNPLRNLNNGCCCNN